MYKRQVEKGTVDEIFHNPSHPYTIGLMASKPVVGKKVDKLYSIPGLSLIHISFMRPPS